MKKRFIISVLVSSLPWCTLLGQTYTRDTSFALDINFFDTSSRAEVSGVHFEQSGNLLVYGEFNDNSASYKRCIVRFLPNGEIDPSFQYPNNFNTEYIHTLMPTDYGYWIKHSPQVVAKISGSGTQIDHAYMYNMANDIGLCGRTDPVFLHDKSIIIGGDYCGYPLGNPTKWFNIMRILPNGRVDTTFQHNPNEAITALLRYDTSTILAGGDFTEYNGISRKHICRIDTLGNLDTTFYSIFTEGLVFPELVQADGKIIVAGNFKIQGHFDWLGMVRLHPDGSIDSTFNNFNNVNIDLDGQILTVCSTSDGGLLVGGRLINYQGIPKGRIAKTDGNGFLEPQYLSGTGIDSQLNPNFTPYVSHISLGPNDQYYIAGYFNGFNGETVQPVIRLNGPLTVSVEPAIARKAAVTVQPNPAKDYTTLTWELPLLESIATFIVTDVTGREVTRHTVNTKQGTWTLDTRSLKAGVYFYQLQKDGEPLTNGKIAVVK